MVGTVLHYVASFSLPIGIMCVMGKLNARRWARLARAYGTHVDHKCVAKRSMQTVILVTGDIGWNSYKGIVTAGVTREGILLKLMPPFSIFHPPLLIPFGDTQIEPKRWYLVGKTFEYRLSRVTNVRMIVHDDLQEWIEAAAANLMADEASAPSAIPIKNHSAGDLTTSVPTTH